jgi:hypothetical protein
VKDRGGEVKGATRSRGRGRVNESYAGASGHSNSVSARTPVTSRRENSVSDALSRAEHRVSETTSRKEHHVGGVLIRGE